MLPSPQFELCLPVGRAWAADPAGFGWCRHPGRSECCVCVWGVGRGCTWRMVQKQGADPTHQYHQDPPGRSEFSSQGCVSMFWTSLKSCVLYLISGTKHFLLMCNVRAEDSGEIKFVARHVQSVACLDVEGIFEQTLKHVSVYSCVSIKSMTKVIETVTSLSQYEQFNEWIQWMLFTLTLVWHLFLCRASCRHCKTSAGQDCCREDSCDPRVHGV